MVRPPFTLPIPGALWGPYPENPEPWFELPTTHRWLKRLEGRLDRRNTPKANHDFIARLRQREAEWQMRPEHERNKALHRLRGTLRRDGLPPHALIEALACATDQARHTLGVTAYDVQLIGARIVLEGGLAEMATGEGKTLTVALAAACGALAGMPVHVMTANDYLVVRDATTFTDYYGALGLRVGTITASSTPDERRAAYACDITYCTGKELVFDYLRDSTVRQHALLRWHTDQLLNGQQATLLRGLCMGIIDEADSILIDEARVPLILSQAAANPDEGAYLRQALALARGLKNPADFLLEPHQHRAILTPGGCDRIERAAGWLGKSWRSRSHRETMVSQALAALHLFARDRDYLVSAEGVHIIDPTTGRLAPGRAWSQGLHQLIELKEGCPLTQPATPLTSITYQRFFPRYVRLGGLSGTLVESADELEEIYGLRVTPVPLRKPSQRRYFPTRLYRDQEALWAAVAERIRQLQAAGRPVLVGTESVADSEALSSVLVASGISHLVLNARHDAQEADIVGKAGTGGRVTVATNMAGRGTDIVLSDEIASLGGLHVINCQLNKARRIDRQLIGRCARQGDPGSVETWLSADNKLLQHNCPAPLVRWLNEHTPVAGGIGLRCLLAVLQYRSELQERVLRRRLLKQDSLLDKKLAFGSRAA